MYFSYFFNNKIKYKKIIFFNIFFPFYFLNILYKKLFLQTFLMEIRLQIILGNAENLDWLFD